MMKKEKLIEALSSSNKTKVTNALLYLTFNIDDFEWVQHACLTVITECDDVDIAGLAITCIGHIARIYGKVDLDKVIPVFNALEDPELIGRAEDAMDDIKIFTKN